MVIYLDLSLPRSSSRLLGTCGRQLCSSTALLRMGFAGPPCLHDAGELLPHLSTLTERVPGCLFLLHCPWSRLHRPLTGILPWEPGLSSTKTFRCDAATIRSARHFCIAYYT